MPMIYNAAFTQNYDTSQYDNPYLFTGRRVDTFDSDSLKLQYNRNRYYDYYTGRWLSQDPLGITPNRQKPNRFAVYVQYQDGMNLFEYVKSQPICYTDSYGLLKKVPIFDNTDTAKLIPVHAWLSGKGAELWDFGPDLQWMQQNLGHQNYKECGIGVYCKGEANWGGNAYANRKGNTIHHQLYFDDEDRWWWRSRRFKAGPYKGAICRCWSASAIKPCLDDVRKQWHGTRYRHLIRNCISFVEDAISKCCLTRGMF